LDFKRPAKGTVQYLRERRSQ